MPSVSPASALIPAAPFSATARPAETRIAPAAARPRTVTVVSPPDSSTPGAATGWPCRRTELGDAGHDHADLACLALRSHRRAGAISPTRARSYARTHANQKRQGNGTGDGLEKRRPPMQLHLLLVACLLCLPGRPAPLRSTVISTATGSPTSPSACRMRMSARWGCRRGQRPVRHRHRLVRHRLPDLDAEQPGGGGRCGSVRLVRLCVGCGRFQR